MAELRNWYIEYLDHTDEPVYILRGAVYGHISPRLYDGLFIHTSGVETVKDKGETLEIQTYNTIYTVKKQSIAANWNITDESNGNRKNLFDFFGHYCGESGSGVAEELLNIILQKQQRSRETAERLGNSMLYLEISPDCEYYFHRAYFRDAGGELTEDTNYVHVGMHQDSVILHKSNVRYFPHQQNGLCFYSTLYDMFDAPSADEDTLLGYIHNSGSLPIRVQFTWGKQIEIKPDETVPVKRSELEDYPDAPLLSTEDLYPAQLL